MQIDDLANDLQITIQMHQKEENKIDDVMILEEKTRF